tara:strand:+ start:732 stop:920 length:189 start_codon:yes stop_codon:yes gene_type:complete
VVSLRNGERLFAIHAALAAIPESSRNLQENPGKSQKIPEYSEKSRGGGVNKMVSVLLYVVKK